MTEPTREPEPRIVPTGPEAMAPAHGPESGEAATRVSSPGGDALPYIKRIPSRRYYDLLLLVPFCAFGASVGTLAISTGLFRHLGLVVACVILFAWIRAGLAIEKAAHLRWLYVMGGLVIVFLACGYLSPFI